MHKLNKYLDPLCVNIVKLITDTNSKVFDNPLYAILGTTAIQIGLVDVLNAIGIEANHMIGYSTGEFACAYADYCLTAEQTILAAYYRGLTLFDSKMIRKSVALSDLNSNEILNDYPIEIDSGEHIKKTNSLGMFGLAEPELLKELRKLIPNPKSRSKKWISKTESTNMKNNTNEELFILEISPDNSFVDILKDVFDKKNIFIGSLMQRNDHNLNTLFNIIGNLYTKGFNPQLAALYPEVQFPVSCGTPMIGHTVKWEHSRKWPVTKEGFSFLEKSLEKTIVIDVTTPKYEYLTGHIVDGRNLFPATGYLALMWHALSDIEGELLENIAVEFEDVQFLRATNISTKNKITFTTMIQKGTGNFEILEGDSVVVTGRIKRLPHNSKELLKLPEVKPIINDTDKLALSSRDIYKELRLRGYNYQNEFKGIISTDNGGFVGQIQWKPGMWTAFMDNMLQLQILQEDARFLYVPTSVQKLTIYPHEHFKHIHEHEDGRQSITVTNYKEYKVLQGGGIQIMGLMATSINRRKPLADAVLEKQEFVPLINCISQKYTVVDAVRIFFQIGLENNPSVKVKVVEVDNEVNDILAPVIFEVLSDLPLIQPDITVLSNRSIQLPNNCQVSNKPLETESKADYIVTYDLLNNPNLESTRLAKCSPAHPEDTICLG
ncbi:fatty acid synthase-like [Chrysoperla carnea]|uniref:fatty acid synthase-like n=1 Tax=Chrysoperla carnea TaxID=189513 RepID=UPI001D06BFA9|nr:fatty acid synthase-like [Chrysoperla carnea]